MTVDLLVIGGGPVGLATALYAVRSGLTAHVIEPRPHPLDKACGEGLMPGGLRALTDLGVAPDGHPFLGIRYLGPGASAVADFSSGPGRGVRRTSLHSALAEAVERAGIELSALAAVDLSQDDERVTVRTRHPGGADGPVLRSRYVVAADGLHSWTRRALDLDRPASRSRRYGQRRHFAVAPWSSHVDVTWGDEAEVYVTPVADDVVGVAVLSRARRPYAQHLASFAELRDRLGGAEPVSAVQGAGTLRQRSRRRVAGRVLLAGDASGYVDALTGEGISIGLGHARAAVAAVAADRPRSYERAWVAASWRPTLLTQVLLQATRPALGRRALVPLAAAAPWVFTAAVNELGRSA
jgi:flavin-dependent dehydrogenase